jgi:hypothetical protein
MTTDTRATTEENRSEEDTRLIPAALQKFLKAGGKKKKRNKQKQAGLLGIQESTKRNAEVITSYVRLPALLISAVSSNREQEECCTPDLNRLRTFESQQDTAMRTTMKSRALERERERERRRRRETMERKGKEK